MAEIPTNILVLDERTQRSHERMKEQEFVLDFVAKSASYRNRYVNIWDELLENYLVSDMSNDIIPAIGDQNYFGLRTQRHPASNGSSQLRDPETHQLVESLASQGLGLLLGHREYLSAVPIGKDDPEKARFLSRILMSVLESPGMFRTHYSILKDAFLFGTAIMEVAWEKRARLQMTQMPVYDEMGQAIGERIAPAPVVYRDAPTLRQVDIYDFYPDPSGTRIQHDMIGVAKRFRVGKHHVEDMAKQRVYDPVATRLAVLSASSSNETPASEARFPREQGATPEKYPILTGFEYWGEVPWRPMDGARNRVITLLSNKNVRSHINPFIDGNLPFKEVVLNPISGRFYGLGAAEVVRFLQDSANAMLMNLTDGANSAVAGTLLVGNAFRGDVERLRRRELLDVIRAGDVNQVKPLPVDFNALQLAAAELVRRKQQMRDAGGSQGLMPAPTTKRQTATETSEIVRLATQRIEIQIQVIERDDYPWLGRTMHSRLRQFLPDEGAVATLAGEQFPFKLSDIDMESDVRFIGSRHVTSRYQKAAGLTQMLSILGTNPMIAKLFPEMIISIYRDGHDIEDAERWVQQASERVDQLMEQNPEMLGGAATPSDPIGQATEGGGVAREGRALA